MRTTFSSSIGSVSSQPKDKSIPKIPRGVRALPVTNGTSSPREELGALQQDVAEIERWWADAARWKHTKRVYTGTYESSICFSCLCVSFCGLIQFDGHPIYHRFFKFVDTQKGALGIHLLPPSSVTDNLKGD